MGANQNKHKEKKDPIEQKKNPKRQKKEEISLIKCTYLIKDNNYTQIINNKDGECINEDIDKKIKIYIDGKKLDLEHKIKFGGSGEYTINFIIEEKLTDMSFMFQNCWSLKRVEFISVETDQVGSMVSMFQNCYELEYVDLSYFDALQVIKMNDMFP